VTLSGWRHARAAETPTFERQIRDDSLPLRDLCSGTASVPTHAGPPGQLGVLQPVTSPSRW
jgi:hypothetical protein